MLRGEPKKNPPLKCLPEIFCATLMRGSQHRAGARFMQGMYSDKGGWRLAVLVSIDFKDNL
jgi:hypothetical protein